MHRPVPRAVGRERKDRRLRERVRRVCCRPAATTRWKPSRGSPASGKAVKLREPRVHHAPVRVQEFAQREAALQHFAEERLRLADHARLERLVVVGIELLVRLEHADLPQPQPLGGKGVREARGAFVREHPRDLPRELGLVPQLPFFREREQFLVRHRAPQQIRKARGDLPVVECVAVRVLVAFGDEKETLRAKDRQHPSLHRVAEFLLRGELRLHDADIAVQFLIRDRPAECTARERARGSRAPAPCSPPRAGNTSARRLCSSSVMIGPRQETESMMRNGYRARPCSSVSFICQGMRPSLMLMNGLSPWRPERGSIRRPRHLVIHLDVRPALRQMRAESDRDRLRPRAR